MSPKEHFVTELFDRYHAMLKKFCWRYVNYEEIYADMIDESVLDTFVQAYSSYERLRNHPNVQGWLIITCFHRLRPRINQVRSYEKYRAFSIDDPQVPQMLLAESWEEKTITQLDARNQLNELCTALTEIERRVFREYYVQGLTIQEMAQRQHRSPGSVKASLRQIKKKANKQKNKKIF